MEVKLAPKAKADLKFWQKSGNKSIQNKIQKLFTDMKLHPFEGLGKPEELKHKLSGQYSRRINQEHRIIYDVTGEIINIYSFRGHY
jgi:toxin YoeB